MSVSNLFNGDGLDLSRSDVSGLFLEGASLNGADLTSACVSDADLYTAWMISADLRNADFSRSDLRKVEGRGCSASGGIFCDARLQSSPSRRVRLGARRTRYGRRRAPVRDARKRTFRHRRHL
ncbi:pentapeptide repeat-containing protein, partial [Nocardia asteroides]|uniref:pentapeptide repeat-containing protein n=1 Tax=Nocardia asteroides TaxID=1824 RepID=UPI0036672EDD